jgi:hypothetical protein
VPISISGHFDFIDDDNPSAPILTDLKCPKTLYYVERDGKPSEHYRKQVLFYCWCTAIPHGRVAYWDGSRWLPFDIDASDQACQTVIEELETKALALWMSLRNGKAPNKQVSNPESWECRYCEYTRFAYGGAINPMTQQQQQYQAFLTPTKNPPQ